MKSKGLAFSRKFFCSKLRTSSSHPAASIASVRAWMRSRNASLGGCKPIFIARQPSSGFRAVRCTCQRLAGQQANLDRANYFLFIGRCDLLRRFGIELFQNCMQMAGFMIYSSFAQPLAQLFGTLRQVREA